MTETIDQAAHHLSKKPGKQAARDIVRGLYDKARDDAERYELAQLYAYFRPAAPKRPKTAWQWVAQAVAGPTHNREYLQYVYVCPKWVTASDGHRMHRYQNYDGLAPGFYDPLGGLIHPPEWRTFPDIARLWKDIASAATISTLERVETEGMTPIGKIDRLLVGAVTVNASYWAQFTNAPDLALPELYVYPEERGGTLQLDGVFPNNATAQAILMGMRP